MTRRILTTSAVLLGCLSIADAKEQLTLATDLSGNLPHPARLKPGYGMGVTVAERFVHGRFYYGPQIRFGMTNWTVDMPYWGGFGTVALLVGPCAGISLADLDLGLSAHLGYGWGIGRAGWEEEPGGISLRVAAQADYHLGSQVALGLFVAASKTFMEIEGPRDPGALSFGGRVVFFFAGAQDKKK